LKEPGRDTSKKSRRIAAGILLVAAAGLVAAALGSCQPDTASVEPLPALKPENADSLGAASFTEYLVNKRLSEAKVGDVIYLGNVSFLDYRGGDFSEDIAWQVLAVEDGRVLVMTQNIIDVRPFDSKQVMAKWEESEIREWLNGDFYSGLPAFVQGRVQETWIENNRSEDTELSGSDSDPDTEDKVFLLSLAEAKLYFASDEGRKAGYDLSEKTIEDIDKDRESHCEMLKYAYSMRSGDETELMLLMSFDDYVLNYGGIYWWLRSPSWAPIGGPFSETKCINDAGSISSLGNVSGMNNVFNFIGPRPAMWLSV